MKRLLLFLLLAVLFTACDKNVTQNETCKTGFILWGGDPAVDGLGWYFSEKEDNSSKAYKFDNLPPAYQKDKLAVRICFYDTGEKYYCFCAVPMPLHHITAIEKKGLFN